MIDTEGSTELFSPEEIRDIERSWDFRKMSALLDLFGPFWRMPVLNVAATFWYGIVMDGIRGTLTPRWGLLTFHYLNDGMHPTLYHTVRTILSPTTGIYPGRAPHSRVEADWVDRNHQPLPPQRVD